MMVFKKHSEIFRVLVLKIEIEIEERGEINICVGHSICQTLSETSVYSFWVLYNFGLIISSIGVENCSLMCWMLSDRLVAVKVSVQCIFCVRSHCCLVKNC